jgi:manganese/zinc/iron transport system ATP- binding protein
VNAIGRFAETPLAESPLAIRGLSAGYGGQAAVLDADMTVAPRALTAIVGPNGAGKSTLLKAALGLIPRQAGEVTFWGEPLAQARPRIAYVPQRASVDWDFPVTVMDVALQGLHREIGLLRPIRAPHRARAQQALERVGLADLAHRQIGALSGGQQQRAFLARALAQGADLFLLDEPFAGVDAATEDAIMGVLRGLRDEGRAVVAVHHDLSTVAAYFDRALLLNRRVLAEGPVALALTPRALQGAYGGRLPAGLAAG